MFQFISLSYSVIQEIEIIESTSRSTTNTTVTSITMTLSLILMLLNLNIINLCNISTIMAVTASGKLILSSSSGLNLLSPERVNSVDLARNSLPKSDLTSSPCFPHRSSQE